jgi:L-alanine-DL-glutamate epimerase-like enolase superfamily enzyme
MGSEPSHGPTIAAVELATVELPVSRDLIVHGARGTHDHSPFLLVRVTTSDGVRGYGEVSATALWSGEDGATARHLISHVLAPAVVAEPLVPVAKLEQRMDTVLAGNPFTKAGVSIALWDAFARTLDVPLAVALGGPLRHEVPVKMSLSGDGDDLLRSYEAAAAEGFSAFKVKVGLHADRDVSRFTLARKTVGPDTLLGMDANGGWNRSDALRAVKAMLADAPAFIEQPLPPDDLTGMRRMRDLGLPVIADESIFGMPDLVDAVRSEACDVVSIYVGKSGGPGRAVAMAQVADAFGVDVVIGCNGEMGLGAAAQLHVACACATLSEAIPSDIFGAHFYDEDILAVPLDNDGSYARLGSASGLGVQLRPDIEERFA